MISKTIFSGEFTTGADMQTVMEKVYINYWIRQQFPNYEGFLRRKLNAGKANTFIAEIFSFRRVEGIHYEDYVIDRRGVLEFFEKNRLRAATTRELLNFIITHPDCLHSFKRTTLFGLSTTYFHGTQERHEDTIVVMPNDKIGDKPWVSSENVSNRISPLWEELPYRDCVFDSLSVFLAIRCK